MYTTVTGLGSRISRAQASRLPMRNIRSLISDGVKQMTYKIYICCHITCTWPFEHKAGKDWSGRFQDNLIEWDILYSGLVSSRAAL